jgi:hypothetical protein
MPAAEMRAAAIAPRGAPDCHSINVNGRHTATISAAIATARRVVKVAG